MGQTAFFGRSSDPFATARGARVRRLLLEQVRYALTTEPAALEIPPDVTADRLTHIRGRVSITVGAIVVRLNQEGFTESDRALRHARRAGPGQAVDRGDSSGSTRLIATEQGLQTGS